MKPFKAKARTQPMQIVKLGGTAQPVRVQAVYYGSFDASSHLHLLDKDGDEFMFPVPGQRTPKVIHLESPVTVMGPLSIHDDSNNMNDVIIFGELE